MLKNVFQNIFKFFIHEKNNTSYQFRIHDILIRILIFGSAHWITDMDPISVPDPALFGSVFQDANN
jgi:hypothetical protein